MRLALGVVLASSVISNSASSQTWFDRTSLVAVLPQARVSHALAYDPIRNYVVMFGGLQGSTQIGDTWTWDGVSWVQRTQANPPLPREGHAMAFDPNLGGVVMFGGYRYQSSSGSTYFQDTWVWNGANWAPVISAQIPSGRRSHAMAYHGGLGATIMFGGTPGVNPETWALFPPTASTPGWVQLSPSTVPGYSQSYGASMVSLGQNVMMHSVTFGSTTAPRFWKFVGNTWTALPSIPVGMLPTGAFSSCCYECALSAAASGRVVAFVPTVGLSGIPVSTYEWDGQSWAARIVATTPGSGCGPVPQQCPSGPLTPVGWFSRDLRLTYDGARAVSVLFSGVGNRQDTWEYDNQARLAVAASAGTGCPASSPLVLSPAPASRPILGSTFIMQATGLPAGSASVSPFATLGLSEASYQGFPLPLGLDGLGLTGCTLYHDAVVVGVPFAPPVAGLAQLLWPLPNQYSLLGFNCFVQAIALAPGLNPAQIVLSQELRLTMGNM